MGPDRPVLRTYELAETVVGFPKMVQQLPLTPVTPSFEIFWAIWFRWWTRKPSLYASEPWPVWGSKAIRLAFRGPGLGFPVFCGQAWNRCHAGVPNSEAWDTGCEVQILEALMPWEKETQRNTSVGQMYDVYYIWLLFWSKSLDFSFGSGKCCSDVMGCDSS